MAAGVPCFPLVSLVLPRRWLVRFVAERSNEGDLFFFFFLSQSMWLSVWTRTTSECKRIASVRATRQKRGRRFCTSGLVGLRHDRTQVVNRDVSDLYA